MTLLTNNALSDINRLFSTNWPDYRRVYRTNPATATESAQTPAVDILKQEDNYLLVAELPGIDKDSINVTIDNNVLTIEATANESVNSENDSAQFLRRERHRGKWVRSFDLGQDIALSDITANFKDGLLTLTIPKQKEEKTTLKIDIH